MKKISLVIPMYYEEQVAEECYRRTRNVLNSIEEYDYEIIFINDGSKDKTLEILETKQRPQYIIEKTININKLRNMSNDFESNKNEKLKERRVVLNTTKD